MMDWRHYFGIVLLIVLGYWLGTKYPGWLTKVSGGVVSG